MSIEQEVKRIESRDGKRRVSVVKLSIGNQTLFRFEEETYRFDDDEYVRDYYWSPSYISGLYGSAEEAERDARVELSWLRDKESD